MFINDRNLRNHNDGPFEIQIDSSHMFNKKCNFGFMEIISFIDPILVLNYQCPCILSNITIHK